MLGLMNGKHGGVYVNPICTGLFANLKDWRGGTFWPPS